MFFFYCSSSFSSGIQGISYGAEFAKGNTVRACIYLYNNEKIRNLFVVLEKQGAETISNFGSPIKWELREEQQYSRIAVYRDGSIESSDSELEEIREWHIENLLKLKEVFQPEIEMALETLNSGEVEDSVQ